MTSSRSTQRCPSTPSDNGRPSSPSRLPITGRRSPTRPSECPISRESDLAARSQHRAGRSPVVIQSPGMTATGHGASFSNQVVTEPSSARAIPPIPRGPTTMKPTTIFRQPGDSHFSGTITTGPRTHSIDIDGALERERRKRERNVPRAGSLARRYLSRNVPPTETPRAPQASHRHPRSTASS